MHLSLLLKRSHHRPASPALLLASITAATLTAVIALPARPALADTIVVPNVTEDVDVSGINTPFRNAGRVYQSYIDETQFTSITQPVQITGMAFRLAIGPNWSPDGIQTTGTWPSQDLTFTQYDVQLSRASTTIRAANEIPSAATTFAANQAGSITTVRSGALTIPANSFTANGSNTTPNVFNFIVNFTTAYIYTPGEELLYTIRHSGYSPSGEPQVFFASTDFANGVADAVSSTAGNASATTPSGFSSPLIVQFQFSPIATVTVPEPGGLALILPALGAISAVGVVRRSIRRRQSPEA